MTLSLWLNTNLQICYNTFLSEMHFTRNTSNQSFTKSKATNSEWCFSQTIFWNSLFWNFAISATLTVIFKYQTTHLQLPSSAFLLFAIFFRIGYVDEHTMLYCIWVSLNNFKLYLPQQLTNQHKEPPFFLR